MESNPGFRSQNLAINQLQHGTSVCLINDCDTKEVYVRGTGGTTPFSSLMDGSERLDSRSDSLNPSNNSPGIRLNEGWVMPVAGMGTVGKRTSFFAGNGIPVFWSLSHGPSL